MSEPHRAHLVPTDPAALAVQLVAQADRHPVAVYLARLAPGSRRTMRQALDAAAPTLAAGHTAETLLWAAVGYQHVRAVRAALLERGKAPATVNKTLAAVRGVLKECCRLGLIGGERYQRAADVAGVKTTTLPWGRALATGELEALLRACTAESYGTAPPPRQRVSVTVVMPRGAPRRHENRRPVPLSWGVAAGVGRPACDWCCEPA